MSEASRLIALFILTFTAGVMIGIIIERLMSEKD